MRNFSWKCVCRLLGRPAFAGQISCLSPQRLPRYGQRRGFLRARVALFHAADRVPCVQRFLNLGDRPLTDQQRLVLVALDGGASVLHVDRTGAGKSLAFMLFPHLFAQGADGVGQVLIVAPLAALCHDIARRLEPIATELGSTVLLLAGAAARDDKATTDDIASVTNGVTLDALAAARFIVVIPELVCRHLSRGHDDFDDVDRYFATPAARPRLRCVVLDEAHLFAHWCEFRPALLDVLRWLRDVEAQKLLLTATLTSRQRELLVLCSKRPLTDVVGDIRRPDLHVHVRLRCGVAEYDYEPLVLAIKGHLPGQCVVVSCSSFKLMVSVVEFLKSHQYTRDKLNAPDIMYSYHGMVSNEEKERALQASESCGVLITNQAFSHGIDLRPALGMKIFVIGAFDSSAMLYQTLSRASRDAQGADVHVLLRGRDFTHAVKKLRASALTLDAEAKRLASTRDASSSSSQRGLASSAPSAVNIAVLRSALANERRDALFALRVRCDSFSLSFVINRFVLTTLLCRRICCKWRASQRRSASASSRC